MISEIKNLPEVSFIENKTLDDVQGEMVKDYQDKFRELTGKELRLRRADAETLKLYAVSVQIYHMMLHIDMAGKMGLLKYSFGEFLDNLGAHKGVTRQTESPSTTTVRFSLSEQRESVTTIPKGTRVSDGDAIFFATDRMGEIPIGEMSVDIPCTCQSAGTKSNGMMAGSINTLVDLIAYIEGVSNVEETSGGSDGESDEDFADRIYLAPSGYSVAGPTDAYKYHARSFSAAVGDIEVTSPRPCEVEVKFLLDDGSLPTDSFCAELQEYLSADSVRPLTDRVRVLAPTVREFPIDFTYYINKSDMDKAISIQTQVAAAVAEFVAWQTSAIGRDINPSVLTQMVMAAGAKRVEVRSPEFEDVPSGHVARVSEQAVVYGGVEND